METEENEQVVAEALRGTTGLKRNVGNELARGLNDKLIPGRDEKTLFDRDGYFRTTPDTLETDGFFAAIISKS
jgi:16S rRNA C967 or C1407 C5-methylase (RsmB/RsmF family)